jgi:sugar lactone lactonase YvrE
MAAPELLWDVKAELGEGPVWRATDRSLWFVDIKGRRLHRYGVSDGAKQSWSAPDQIGFALPAEDGSLICGLRGGLHRFAPETGTFRLVARVEEDRPQNRLNDGFIAPDGSLWFGSMDDDEAKPSGALYRYANGVLERRDDGYIVTNGPALCPKSRTLYHNDTLGGCIYAFDHEDGHLSNKRLFAKVSDGYCDGPSVDADGVLHVGLFNGWGVARFDPSGRRLENIPFPVMTVTKAAFGGDDLRTLFCTTAWLNNSDKRAEQPTLGGLYSVRVERPGLPQSLFRW